MLLEKFEELNKKIVDYVYVVSKQPVLYRDLLRANLLFNEGMYIDPAILNFRKNIKKAYISYGLICFAIFTPLLLLTHTLFTKIDFHISIVGTIFATSFIFIGFDFFKDWIRTEISRRQIKEAWKLHFPYFPYEKYSQKVELIYQKALKEEVSKKDLEKYVMDNLIKD